VRKLREMSMGCIASTKSYMHDALKMKRCWKIDDLCIAAALKRVLVLVLVIRYDIGKKLRLK